MGWAWSSGNLLRKYVSVQAEVYICVFLTVLSSDTGERTLTLNVGSKLDMAQEHTSHDGNSTNATEEVKRPDGIDNPNIGTYNTSHGYCRSSGYYSEGYNPQTGGWEDGMGFDARNVYPGVHVENGPVMYYASGYGYHQPSYCSHPPPGTYISSMDAGAQGYGSQAYGHFYQQVPASSGMHYYSSLPFSTGQEGSMLGPGKLNSNGTGQQQKSKVAMGPRPGYHGGYQGSNGSNRWGTSRTAGPNARFQDSQSGHEIFPQQWHSSARCLQPPSATQNAAMSGNRTPPLPAVCARQQAFPRTNSAPNIVGRGGQGGLKVRSVKAGSTGSNWRAKELQQGKSDGHINITNASGDNWTDQGQRPRAMKFKGHQTATQGCPNGPHEIAVMDSEYQNDSVNRSEYNKEDFQTTLEEAKFFIIKSYSEDDVHKSIKYNVWSSTPNGNKRLDGAYREAHVKAGSTETTCPIFFFFSVNSSGQFCGVAEMVGPVDFSKNMDFWLQGKWNGCFPVKWHIIKDVPNCHFRHIILSNNDNKPVTHSRDTQEVYLDQGIDMLKIFKIFPLKTSLLDDFAFYDGRQRVLQERKSRQQIHRQAVKRDDLRPSDNEARAEAFRDEDKENGRPGELPEVDLKCANSEGKISDVKAEVEASTKVLVETNEEASVDTVDNKSKSKPDLGPLSEGKDDLTSTIINYKKALLEGVQGKVNVLDKTVTVSA